MFTLWLLTCQKTAVAGTTGGGGGVGILRTLSADQERRLDAALNQLERRVKQARTPRRRRLALAVAEAATAEALATLPIRGPVVAPIFVDLTEVSVMLRQISAGLLPFSDWRQTIADTIRRARLLLLAEQGEREDDDLVMLLLAG